MGDLTALRSLSGTCYCARKKKRGRIKNLQRQVKFELIPKQTDSKGKLLERACYYIADFVYEKKGKQVVEDVKSRITVSVASFVIKRKLMLYKHNIAIKRGLIFKERTKHYECLVLFA